MSNRKLEYEYFAPIGAVGSLPDKLVVTITPIDGALVYTAKAYNGLRECPLGEAHPALAQKLHHLHASWQETGCAFNDMPTASITDADGKELRIVGMLHTHQPRNLNGDPIAYEHALLGKIHDVASHAHMRLGGEQNPLRRSMELRGMSRVASHDRADNLRPLGR